jgi:hypothetical protein
MWPFVLVKYASCNTTIVNLKHHNLPTKANHSEKREREISSRVPRRSQSNLTTHSLTTLSNNPLTEREREGETTKEEKAYNNRRRPFLKHAHKINTQTHVHTQAPIDNLQREYHYSSCMKSRNRASSSFLTNLPFTRRRESAKLLRTSYLTVFSHTRCCLLAAKRCIR